MVTRRARFVTAFGVELRRAARGGKQLPRSKRQDP